MKRPLLPTIVAWTIIVVSAICLVLSFFTIHLTDSLFKALTAQPHDLQLLILWIDIPPLLLIVIGASALLSANWARALFAIHIQRPLSVTIICWLTIVVSLLDISMNILLLHTHLILLIQGDIITEGQYLYFFLGIAFDIASTISAVFMLHRANWARFSFMILCVAPSFGIPHLLIFQRDRPDDIGPFLFEMAVTVVPILFVLLPKANEYFSKSPKAA